MPEKEFTQNILKRHEAMISSDYVKNKNNKNTCFSRTNKFYFDSLKSFVSTILDYNKTNLLMIQGYKNYYEKANKIS